ncbi:MAG: hypothetical protein IJQ23_00785, partial [Clostridia bacterium]|nr:hypothetical protein [Clostridia bacterium]
MDLMVILQGKTRRIWAFVLVFAFVLVVVFSSNAGFSVKAGASKVYVASSASVRGDEINGGDFIIDGGVYAEDSKVVFDKKSAKSARLLAKTRINNLKDYGITELFDMSATF